MKALLLYSAVVIMMFISQGWETGQFNGEQTNEPVLKKKSEL